MLLKSNNYDHLYKSFKWNIPSYFNIATSTIDKKEYQNRTALIDVLDIMGLASGHMSTIPPH